MLYPNKYRTIVGLWPQAWSSDSATRSPFQRIGGDPIAFFANEGVLPYTSIPEGMSESRIVGIMALEGGGMALDAIGDGDLAADLLPSRNMTIDITGVGDLDATGSLVVSLLAAWSGSGSLTATITGRLNATIDMTGSGDLDASMAGIASMVVDMLGVGDLDATIAAIGDMEIDIVSTGSLLTTGNVGAAVWGQLIEAGIDAAGILRILAAVAAGESTIIDLGGGLATVTFKGIDDVTNRVVADMDNSERTDVTLDADL